MARQSGSGVKNVLLVTVDSLRYGWTLTADPELPAVGRLLEEGDSFEHAYATGPGTTPSFPGMLTGTLPLSYGSLGPLTPERPRVASKLKSQGLTTGAFQSNPFLSRHFNYDEGFDAFEDYQNPLMGVATKIFPRGIELNNPKLERIDEVLHLTDLIKKTYTVLRGKPRPYVSAETITDDAINWLDNMNDPFFGWVHYMDVHHPCFPPKEYREQFDVGSVSQSDVSEWYSNLLTEPESLTQDQISALERLYDAAIAYTDSQIGRVIDKLREDERYDDTLIVLTSDHGELFGEHGSYGKPERFYEELIRVPLVIVNGPDVLTESTDELVSLLDLPPLFHEALELPVPNTYEGKRIGREEREFVVAEHEVQGDPLTSARSKNWLYEGDEIRGEHRLFDLRDGSFEQVDPNLDEEVTVREVVLARLQELDVDAQFLQEEVGGDVEDRLEDLGYL